MAFTVNVLNKYKVHILICSVLHIISTVISSFCKNKIKFIVNTSEKSLLSLKWYNSFMHPTWLCTSLCTHTVYLQLSSYRYYLSDTRGGSAYWNCSHDESSVFNDFWTGLNCIQSTMDSRWVFQRILKGIRPL